MKTAMSANALLHEPIAPLWAAERPEDIFLCRYCHRVRDWQKAHTEPCSYCGLWEGELDRKPR